MLVLVTMGRGDALPIEIILQSEILSDQDGLAIFFDHVEVIGGVDLALEKDP